MTDLDSDDYDWRQRVSHKYNWQCLKKLEMWANAQLDGRPAEYR